MQNRFRISVALHWTEQERSLPRRWQRQPVSTRQAGRLRSSTKAGICWRWNGWTRHLPPVRILRLARHAHRRCSKNRQESLKKRLKADVPRWSRSVEICRISHPCKVGFLSNGKGKSLEPLE